MTPKQEAFCLDYIIHGNATKAYRAAGYSSGMSDKTAGEAASRLLKNSKVIAKIKALRAPLEAMECATVEQHLADLKLLREEARRDGKYAAAVAAEVARGKVRGFYIEKVEHSGEIARPELRLVLNGTVAASAAKPRVHH